MRYVKSAFIIVYLFLPAPSFALSHEHACTHEEAIAAESVTDYMDSWKNMHIAYKQYKQCDDASIAEGFSEASARLFADHWNDVPKLLPIMKADPAFGEWAVHHLDNTDNDIDLSKIDHLSQTACPAHATKLCNMLHQQIQ